MSYRLLFLLHLLFSMLFFAQKTDSTRIFNAPYTFKYEKLAVPAVMVGAGTTLLLTTDREIKYHGQNYGLGSYAEDYLQFVPLVSSTAFHLAGMKSRTDGINKVALGVKTAAINFGTVTAVKLLTKKDRPDGTNKKGFPSSHTSSAFAGATGLTIEYGKNYPWVPYAAYTLAAGVGALRIVHNKHYLSDVLVGAGIGILSSKIAYWTHQYKWKTKKENDIFSGVLYDK